MHYFMVRKQWAVRKSYEKLSRFVTVISFRNNEKEATHLSLPTLDEWQSAIKPIQAHQNRYGR